MARITTEDKKVHFTKAAVESLRCPDEKRTGVYYFDDEQRNLAVRVMPSGLKTFVLSREVRNFSKSRNKN
ncbi:hypothetical protein HQ520_10875 [bacterium]|nr:hypothetical protein [bacterium]